MNLAAHHLSSESLMLSLNSISITPTHGTSPLFENLSMHLQAGEILGLLDANGSGKSVLAHAICGLLNEKDFLWKGGIKIRGASYTPFLDPLHKRPAVYIPQNVTQAFDPTHTVKKQMNAVLHLPHVDKVKAKNRLEDLLKRLDISADLLEKYPHQLSGGELQRCLIAICLLSPPPLIVADEPTAFLNDALASNVMQLFQDIVNEEKHSVFLITHRTQDLAYCHRLTSIHGIAQTAQSEISKIIPPKCFHSKNLLLEAHNLTLKHTGQEMLLLDDAQFHIYKGETVGILGESGAGKTSLAMALMQELSYTGTIRFKGMDLKKLPDSLKSEVGYVFQNAKRSLHPLYSFEEYFKIMGTAPNLITHLPKALATKPAHLLSGGEAQKVAIQIALLKEPTLLILDEPTASVDHAGKNKLQKILKDLQANHEKTFLIISHDVAFLKQNCHRIYSLKNHGLEALNEG